MAVFICSGVGVIRSSPLPNPFSCLPAFRICAHQSHENPLCRPGVELFFIFDLSHERGQLLKSRMCQNTGEFMNYAVHVTVKTLRLRHNDFQVFDAKASPEAAPLSTIFLDEKNSIVL